LSLTKTVESGKVKQNFQRGRSKTVTVEVKKTRTFSQRPGGMVEVDRGTSEAAKQRMLNQAEREPACAPFNKPKKRMKLAIRKPSPISHARSRKMMAMI